MLSPGKHSTGDIPRMVEEAAAPFPKLAVRVTSAFGVHEKLGEIILGRAGLPVATPLTSEEAARMRFSRALRSVRAELEKEGIEP